MKNKNPFLYSDDNKRYHTWNYACRHSYYEKVYKVALHANFTCPNRDGTCGIGGCIFCGSMGSGEFAEQSHECIKEQYETGKQRLQKKHNGPKTMAYFQAFTNTYAPVSVLRDTFEPFLTVDDIVALCIATRADCLEDDKIAYLNSLTSKKDIWIELGLQTIHDESAKFLHRGHTYQTFLDCITRLQNTNLKICVHIINSLPYESDAMMMETCTAIAKLPIHAVKIHMLHVMKHTQLATLYEASPFPLLSKEDYIDLVIRQLEVLPRNIIIQRLTGDAPKETLLAPIWTSNKKVVLNDIDKEMVRRDTWQGKKHDETI